MKKSLMVNHTIYDIENIYNNYIFNIYQNDCDKMFYIRSNTTELKLIDLSDYSVTSPEFLKGKIIGSGFSLCRLKEDFFFYYGGYANSKRFGNAYIIDLKKSSCIELQSQNPCSSSGLVLKNDIVYIFGGYGNNHLSSCLSFNTKVNKWENISSLPVGISACTATLNSFKIILTGRCASYLYFFDEEMQIYKEIIPLSTEIFKYAVENFIIFNNILLVDEDHEFKYKLYPNLGFDIKNLSPYCFFRRKNFIYFIEFEGRLFRINCKEKKIEYVTYIS